MNIRPILFAPIMVRALLDDRKTQTRRLSTSPLAKVEPGDLLYVREPWLQPFKETENLSGCIFRADGTEFAGLKQPVHQWGKEQKWKPAMHHKRKHSRITLHVRDKVFEPLQSISAMDAQAEGLSVWPTGAAQVPCYNHHATPDVVHEDPRAAFFELWNSLHDKQGERVIDNPEVVALTFEVIVRNVDRIDPGDL